MTRQAVTKPLAVLEAANLVVARKRGREKLRHLDPVPIREIAERWIGQYERSRVPALADLKRSLEEADQPERRATGEEAKPLAATRRKTPMAESRFLYVTYIRTIPEKLWEALTKLEFTRTCWFGTHQESDWQKGASWKLVFADGRVADTGKILEIDPPRLLVLGWRHQLMQELRDEAETRFRFELEPEEAWVKFTVRHEADGPNTVIDAVSNGWPRLLSSLKSRLETGQGLPRTDRLPGR